MARVAMIHDEPPTVLAALQEEALRHANSKLTTAFRMADGTVKSIPLHAHFRPQYKDEYTSQPLPRSWVEAAIKEEIDDFNQHVWVGVPIETALQDPGQNCGLTVDHLE